MKNKDFDWKKYLLKCLESTNYCSIATVDKNGVWSNPVYFAWDKTFNLYFISQPHVRHMQNIKKDSHVAVSIYATNQKGDYVKGIQLEGKARIIENDGKQDEFFYAYKVYYTRTGEYKENEAIVMNNEWMFVKVTPDKIYYFNNEIFGEVRQEIPWDKIKK